MADKKKVYIIPCSGIGKVFGSMSRETAYIVVNELAHDRTEIECLPLIMTGKKEVVERLRANKIISIDGCPMKCSFHDITEAIGRVDAEFMTPDIIKENRDLKPETTIFPMGDNAKKLSRKLAEQVVEKVDELLNQDEEET
jgi:uncharacterized metal-binding protein